MPADTAITDALTHIRDQLKTITPGSGFTYDLSIAGRVDIGRFLQPPKVPAGPPFVRVAFREEAAWESAPNGKQVRRVADYDVIGWVKGESAPGPLSNSVPDRAIAAALLLDDIHSALLADRRMPDPGGSPTRALASNVSVRGATFNGDVQNTARNYGVVVCLIRVFFAWKSG